MIIASAYVFYHKENYDVQLYNMIYINCLSFCQLV